MPGRQLSFKGFDRETKRDFGGDLVRGHARERRPISLKRPMHLVLRSTLAKGERSFLANKRAKQIAAIIERSAKAQGVKVYRFANSGNHLHLIVLPGSRAAYFAFVRGISGAIARLTLGAQRGSAKGLKFWDAIPFTRLIEWGRDYKRACHYVLRNTLEALGFVPYRERKSRSRRRSSV